MNLNSVSLHQFEPKWSVVFQISHSTGQCRKECMNCHCLQRIVQWCIENSITVPHYDETKEYPDPIFVMSEKELLQLRTYLLKLPEPEIW